MIEAGGVHFFRDIYGEDAALEEARISRSHPEQQTEFRPVDLPLPSSNPSNIHMNKFRLWVVANSATAKAEGNISQFRSGYSGNTDVNGLSLHVQAVRSHAGGSAS
jgi:hypothetical protein